MTSRKDWLTTKNRFVTDLSLIRRWRTTARKNTRWLRTSYLLELLRPTWRRSKVIHTYEVQLQNSNRQQETKDTVATTFGARPLVKTL